MDDAARLGPLLVEPRVERRLDARLLLALEDLTRLDVDDDEVVGLEVAEAVPARLDYALVRSRDPGAYVTGCAVCELLGPNICLPTLARRSLRSFSTVSMDNQYETKAAFL